MPGEIVLIPIFLLMLAASVVLVAGVVLLVLRANKRKPDLSSGKCEGELSTLNTVEEAIREAQRYRRICYVTLCTLAVFWGLLLMIWRVARSGVMVYTLMFLSLAILYCMLVKTDSRIKTLLLSRQLLRDAEQKQNAKG